MVKSHCTIKSHCNWSNAINKPFWDIRS